MKRQRWKISLEALEIMKQIKVCERQRESVKALRKGDRTKMPQPAPTEPQTIEPATDIQSDEHASQTL